MILCGIRHGKMIHWYIDKLPGADLDAVESGTALVHMAWD